MLVCHLTRCVMPCLRRYRHHYGKMPRRRQPSRSIGGQWEAAKMKMLFCIVQNEDAGGLVTALTKEGYRSTRYQSHGGFLRQGNATILVGAPDDKVSDIIAVVRRSC